MMRGQSGKQHRKRWTWMGNPYRVSQGTVSIFVREWQNHRIREGPSGFLNSRGAQIIQWEVIKNSCHAQLLQSVSQCINKHHVWLTSWSHGGYQDEGFDVVEHSPTRDPWWCYLCFNVCIYPCQIVISTVFVCSPKTWRNRDTLSPYKHTHTLPRPHNILSYSHAPEFLARCHLGYFGPTWKLGDGEICVFGESRQF